jgi:hypothetical protein
VRWGLEMRIRDQDPKLTNKEKFSPTFWSKKRGNKKADSRKEKYGTKLEKPTNT